MVGEICALQGQIEEALQDCVRNVLGLSSKATRTIMGSNSLRVNASIWAHVVIEKGPKDADVRWAVDQAVKMFESHTTARNDFVHAVFSQMMTNTDEDGAQFHTLVRTHGGPFRIVDGAKVTVPPTVAIRTSTRKLTPVKTLKGARDFASRLAHLTDFVRDAISPGLIGVPSLSRRGLGPLPSFPKRRPRLEIDFAPLPPASPASPRKPKGQRKKERKAKVAARAKKDGG